MPAGVWRDGAANTLAPLVERTLAGANDAVDVVVALASTFAPVASIDDDDAAVDDEATTVASLAVAMEVEVEAAGPEVEPEP